MKSSKEIFPFYGIGHFINQPHNATEFEILRFGKMQEPDIDDYHKHTFYEILWTEAGESRQTIDYKEYKVNPNTLFFISPNQVHYFEEWKPLIGGTILFTEDFYLLNRSNKDPLFELSFLDNLYSNPCIEFADAEFATILQLINEIDQEQSAPDRSLIVIQAYLQILMARVQKHIDRKNQQAVVSKKYLIQFKIFKQELEENFAKNETASYYADKLSITQHHLNLICKDITHTTATEVIRARSILEAKRLLTFTNKTVSEIAFDLNFSDSSYLAKTFKAFVHQTPQDFRSQMSEKYRTR
jgi:AraC family transcriptional regulator, transcriptional activator of pobA